jgi:CHAD domain-containing protein
MRGHRSHDPTAVTYGFPTEEAARAALERFRARFHTRVEVEPEWQATYYDTFDWRLHRHGGGLAVFADGGEWEIAWESLDGEVRLRLRTTEPPVFARSLPAGPFHDAVAPVIGVRRLLPLVSMHGRSETLAVLAANERTLVRVRLELITAYPIQSEGQQVLVPPRITVAPVPGYALAHEVARRFAAEELGLVPRTAGRLALALEVLGMEPARTSSRVAVTLHPRMRSDLAAKEILRSLLDSIVANEEGARADLDPEFLHDFRVAVRRTRSCLSQLPGLFPEELVERFRGEFSWLGELTGPTRDLDVYLGKMPDYRTALPVEIRSDLAPLAAFLRNRQAQEQSRLAIGLDSERYRELVKSWRVFLETSSPLRADLPNAGRPILELAGERIARAYERVLEGGRSIGHEPPAERLHGVRIDCKKLRYLLEFFESLYDRRDLEDLVKELQRLQDNLGDFNDLQIQRSGLTGFARAMRAEREVPVEALIAMGRLVEQLERRQEKERKLFRKRFRRFASSENRERLERMLATQAPDLPAPARERLADADLLPGPPIRKEWPA